MREALPPAAVAGRARIERPPGRQPPPAHEVQQPAGAADLAAIGASQALAWPERSTASTESISDEIVPSPASTRTSSV